MKKLITILVIWIAAFNVGSGQAFVQLSNATGYEYSLSEKTLIEESSINLLDSIQLDYSIMKVFDFGFYSNTKNMDGNLDDTWDKAISKAFSLARHHIVIGRFYNNEGLLEIRIYSDLPDFNSCITDQNKEEINLNLTYGITGNDTYEIAHNIVSAFGDLSSMLANRIRCCGSRDDCPLSFLEKKAVLSELYEYGYLVYPIQITSLPALNQDSQIGRSSACDVVNNSSAVFNIGSISECNLEERICSFVSQFQGTNSKFYISDNNTYAKTFKQVKSDFFDQNNDYDFAAHFHLYDSSDEDKLPDLILYFDYSASDVQWCDDVSSFDPQTFIYTPFKFADKLPKLHGDLIPNYPHLKWTDWDYYYGESYLIQTQACANNIGIPNKDIHIYAYNQELSKIGFLLDLFNPMGNSNYAGGDVYKQSILTHTENDIAKIWAYSNKDVTYSSWSEYFVVDEFNKYVTIPTYGGDDVLYYIDDGKPILDASALEFRFGNYNKEGVAYALSGSSSAKGLTFAKNAFNKLPNKGIVSSNLGNQIYKIIVNGEIYIGRTKNSLKGAMFRHSKGFEKWKNLQFDQYSIDQLFSQGKTILSGIESKQAWKGMEELMIQGYKALGKNFPGGLNKIHARNPLKKKEYKDAILAAKKWILDQSDSVIKGFEDDFGKSIDDLVEEIFIKYDII